MESPLIEHSMLLLEVHLLVSFFYQIDGHVTDECLVVI